MAPDQGGTFGWSAGRKLLQSASVHFFALAKHGPKWQMTAVMYMDEELELVLERVVATVHAKHGRSAEQLAAVMRISEDDMFDHLSELVIQSSDGLVV